jgi:NTP pyrophosphatase (non-canonical NTP hydrolase)
MNFNEYTRLAAKTANEDLSYEIKLASAALGLSGEMAELGRELEIGDREVQLEEIGDVFWYVARLTDLLDIEASLSFISIISTKLTVDWAMSRNLMGGLLLHSQGHIADAIKKYLAHGHELDRDNIASALSFIFVALARIAENLDSSIEQVAAANIAKLQARYPDGFSEERSRNREDG